MHHDGITLGKLVEDMTRPPARVHEVLGNDFKPVHVRLMLKQVRKMDRAQADPKSKIGMPATKLRQQWLSKHYYFVASGEDGRITPAGVCGTLPTRNRVAISMASLSNSRGCVGA